MLNTERSYNLSDCAQSQGSYYLSDCIQLLQDGIFILLSEASCQQLIYLLQEE